MKRLDLKVGFQCNNRCVFCIQGDKRYTTPNKSDKEVRQILEKMRKNHDGVVFTGGEPTVRPELIDWVKYAKKLGYKYIQIQSNGRMFSYKDYCKVLIKAGANEFSPALHGSTAKIHNALTRAPGSFEQTVQGIKNLRELDQYILTNTVVMRMNYKDLPNLARLLVDLKVDQFQFAFMHINQIIAHNKKLIDKIVPRYKESVPYIKKGIDIGVKAGIRVMVEAVPYCFMKGYEKYISEQYIPFTSVIDNQLELADYGTYRKTKGKAKGPQCKKCKYDRICEGPWREYPEIFGWSEFKPVIK
jgi:MoaA/NifB/PqqE/SkfB family radical SAM enzyme